MPSDILFDDRDLAAMERTGPDKKPSNEASTDQRSIRSGDVALEKRISIASALGVAYSATCAPIAILIFLSLTIGIGGSPVFIYAYIIYCDEHVCLHQSCRDVVGQAPCSRTNFLERTIRP
jgi:hypothetical protein